MRDRSPLALIQFGLGLLAVTVTGLFFSTLAVMAQDETDLAASATDYDIQLGASDPMELITSIINWSLGILALIAVIIIIWGGVIWILSRGEEEKILKAKTILRNGLIGLGIILSAWGIATYVLNLLLDFTDAPGFYDTPDDEITYGDGSPFFVDHTNPSDGEEEVTLCHIVAATFSFPLNEETVDEDSFHTFIPRDSVSNPTGGLSDGDSCSDDVQCRSGVCTESSVCDGDQLAGSFDFSESGYSAVFYPSVDYQDNTTYKVQLDTTIEGIDPETGAVYNLSSSDSKRIFEFTTGTETDEIPPTVDVVQVTPYPEDGATEICLNPTLQIGFSESLDPASPDDENIWLYGYDGSDPADELDIDNVRLLSMGGEADDTIVTSPEVELSEFTEYGMNLYSGDADTDTFENAIYDTCGNPLSGDFDDEMEGSPTDDFVDATSAGLDQAFCSCTEGVDTCNVDVGESSCEIDADTTCTLDSACSDAHEDYVGFEYQWTWTTGDQPYCSPEIDSITQEDNYYSEDEDPYGDTGSEDTGKVLISGDYLYPFYDIDFYKNISAAGIQCFDTDHEPNMSCFVSNTGSTSITVRTPVGSRDGSVTVENADGEDTSADVLTVDSPYIQYTSPNDGPVGQFVTIKGTNFGEDEGLVYFDDILATVQCEDGWSDDAIIVAVPDGLADYETPKIQVIHADNYYSNQATFEMTDGDPGPGICELSPDCSDDGSENVIAYGENFGDSGTAYFNGSGEGYEEADIATWNDYDVGEDSQYIETSSTPVTEVDTYDFTAANDDGISNGLDYTITCSEQPEVFEFNQCSMDEDLWYLPNPRGNEKNACVNSVSMIAFTDNMDYTTTVANTNMYKCNYGFEDDGETLIDFDDTECSETISGTFVVEAISDAFLGGDGTGTLNGTEDVDGDGDEDYYEGYTFYPSSLDAAYWYKIEVTTGALNEDGVPLAEDYSFSFRIRNDVEDCVADALSVAPYSQIENSYDSSAACLQNYEYDSDDDGSDEDYTYRARPATSGCLLLDDAGTYNWEIDDEDIVQFGDSDDASQGDTDTTSNGYDTICLQGEETANTGDATVTVNLMNPADITEVAASDTAVVTVDFGYCTSDADCITDECSNTTCDVETSHCTPEITSFTPNKSTDDDPTNDSDPDVGPGGCITLNGCYFGPDRAEADSCTCTSVVDETECSVNDGDSTCLLPSRTDTCSLGESLCELSEECSYTSSTAEFASVDDGGGFIGCTCTSGSDTCTVEDEEESCVITGTDVCSSSYSTYVEPNEGSVTFNTTDAEYPSEVYCADVWDNEQVIAQVPETLAADDYAITLYSYYYNDILGFYLNDTYDDDTCSVGTEATPCLCTVDANAAAENDLVDLFGENFTLLDPGSGNEEVTFTDSTSRTATDGSESWDSDNQISDAPVPEGAVSDDEEGVQLENDSLGITSNALEFSVQCESNFDCATGCCSDNQCASAEVCNACESTDDCVDGACSSECVDGQCAPTITAVSPEVGAVGQPVTVQGCFFGAYYDSDTYDPYSRVTVDDIEASLACSETDSWSNSKVIITIPDGIFASDEDTTGEVLLRQVSDSGASTQDSNTATFTQDNSCSTVDIPVLCDATPAYSAFDDDEDTDDSTGSTDTNILYEGENFYEAVDGYCTCETDSLGECDVDEGDTSCTIEATNTYYVNPDDTGEPCSDGTTEYNDEVINATSNTYTLYEHKPGETWCTYVDPEDSSVSCQIAVGDTSCEETESETCYADPDYPTTSDACASDFENYTSLSGEFSYTDTIEGDINFLGSTDELYYVNVPYESQTGDVHAVAVMEDTTQCVSNGLEFPITCDACGDCGDTGLNCDLTFDDAFGSCTAEVTGFCRENTNSCCNTTSCVYDDSADEDDDGGTCVTQPTILFDEYNDDGDLTSNADTNPEHEDVDICPNGEFKLDFSLPVTTEDFFGDTETDESEVNFEDYIFLRPSSVDDGDVDTVIDDITVGSDQSTLTLTQSALLDFETEYEIIILANPEIESDNDYQQGVISRDNGAAVYCSTDQIADGLCDEDTYVRYTFTTIAEASFEEACGPSYVVLEADGEEFVEDGYIFTEENQEEDFSASVYAAGVDQYPDDGETDFNGDGTYDADADNDGDGEDDGDDDQAIVRIADEMYWEYEWDPVYETIEDLEAASCPVAGIISGGETGTCSCDYEDTCEVTAGNPYCEIVNDADTLRCFTDSPTAVCDELDSTWDGSACTCTLAASCSVAAGESSCSIDITSEDFEYDEASSCDIGESCGDTYEGWITGDFVEDDNQQVVTADGVEDTDTITVDVIGDETVDDWTDDDSQAVEVTFCPDADYLVSYDNDEYNFSWSYCRGDDPQSDDFLPEFEAKFSLDEANGNEVTNTYGADAEFVYEAIFRDTTSQGNYFEANNNTIAVRVYDNNLDDDRSTIEDSVGPALWFLLKGTASSAGYSEEEIDGYQAVKVGNSYYIAATNYDDTGSSIEPGALTPYIFVIAWSQEASEETQAVVDQLVESIRFNSNASGVFDDECKLEKRKVVRDTKRVNDLGTITYLLSSYYYNDADGNDAADFPDVQSGSFIAGLTGSVWSSWNSTLGNELGQSLPTDPINTYDDAENNCPFDPPDIEQGEDPDSGSYYDETGTCWDPIYQDYYGPEGSYLYQYQWRADTCNASAGACDISGIKCESDDDCDIFALYSDLEYTGTYSWEDASTWNPCSQYANGDTVSGDISDFSNDGCETFNYMTQSTSTTLDSDYYDNNFSE